MRSIRTRFTRRRSNFRIRRRGRSIPGRDAEATHEREIERLHAKIGQLTVERDLYEGLLYEGLSVKGSGSHIYGVSILKVGSFS